MQILQEHECFDTMNIIHGKIELDFDKFTQNYPTNVQEKKKPQVFLIFQQLCHLCPFCKT